MGLVLVHDPLLEEPLVRFNNWILREKLPPNCRLLCADIEIGKVIPPIFPTLFVDLPRRAGKRRLPYLKDMLDCALGWYHPGRDPWIGFFNADIKLTDRFWSSTKAHREETDIFLTKRTDLEHVKQDPETGRRLLDDSTDGIVIRASIWEEHRDTYPDFILGEPGWGYGTNLWVRQRRLRVRQLRNHECLHIAHDGLWKVEDSPEQRHNLELYARMKTWNPES